MGILADLIKKKLNDDAPKNIEYDVADVGVREMQGNGVPMEVLYTKAWLNRAVIHNGFVPNSDGNKVEKILQALQRRNGQCPCGGNGQQYKCPCIIMREHGICKCGLFESIPPRPIKGNSTASISK